MDAWITFPLTVTGTPVLLEAEHVIEMQGQPIVPLSLLPLYPLPHSLLSIPNYLICRCKGDCKLYDGDNKTPFVGGVVYFTSHRLLYIDPSRLTPRALELKYIEAIEPESSLFG